MKTYVIHMSKTKEREPYVKILKDTFGAEVFEGISGEKLDSFLPGQVGCFQSHYAIYLSLPPNEDVLIFEDDCEVLDPSVKDLLRTLKRDYDIIYLGCYHIYKKNGYTKSHGTFGYWLSSETVKLLLKDLTMKEPIDHHLCTIAETYKLRVWRSTPKDKYIKQKVGLRSTICGINKDKQD